MTQFTPGQYRRTTRKYHLIYWKAIGAVEIWALDWGLVRVRFLQHKK